MSLLVAVLLYGVGPGVGDRIEKSRLDRVAPFFAPCPASGALRLPSNLQPAPAG
jgi:hypothetical protein